MNPLDSAYLDRLARYFASGDLAFDFENGDGKRREDILEFLEKLMDLADAADELATKFIFGNGTLQQLAGVGDASAKDQK